MCRYAKVQMPEFKRFEVIFLSNQTLGCINNLTRSNSSANMHIRISTHQICLPVALIFYRRTPPLF